MSAAVLEAPSDVQPQPAPEQAEGFDALVEQMVDRFPFLSDEDKPELGRLLALTP